MGAAWDSSTLPPAKAAPGWPQTRLIPARAPSWAAALGPLHTSRSFLPFQGRQGLTPGLLTAQWGQSVARGVPLTTLHHRVCHSSTEPRSAPVVRSYGNEVRNGLPTAGWERRAPRTANQPRGLGREQVQRPQLQPSRNAGSCGSQGLSPGPGTAAVLCARCAGGPGSNPSAKYTNVTRRRAGQVATREHDLRNGTSVLSLVVTACHPCVRGHHGEKLREDREHVVKSTSVLQMQRPRPRDGGRLAQGSQGAGLLGRPLSRPRMCMRPWDSSQQ